VELLHVKSIANFNDLQPLASDPGLELSWRRPGQKGGMKAPDLVVIPGSKFTLADMQEFNRSGETQRLRRLAGQGSWILGICGGLQMLGGGIDDALGIDGVKGAKAKGIGLLDAETTMHPRKISEQSTVSSTSSLGSFELTGFEIHHGRTILGSGAKDHVDNPMRERPLLASDPSGRIWGSYMHGLLDNDAFRRAFLRRVASSRRRRYAASLRNTADEREAMLDRWSAHVQRHLRLDWIPGFPA
jgi:adenosylcobyric acid synthase